MLGHYLITLTPEQEDRVLTTPMQGCTLSLVPRAAGCLVQAVHPGIGSVGALFKSARNISILSFTVGSNVAVAYDQLCRRFGNERTNVAIRNRILANRARRELAKQRLLEAVR